MITEFGDANVGNNGYLVVHGGNNHNKYLHRLIYEKFHRLTLLSSAIIHHKDGNKLNNSIDNLELMSRAEHNKLHHKNKKNSVTTIEKMRKSKMGKNNPNFGTGNSGYYRVYKVNRPNCKQGYGWVYEYKENGKPKTISRVDLKKLELEVKNRGLKWFKIEEMI